MNNFFNNFNKIFFSFFGIGYIPKVSEFFAAILTLTLALQIPDENRAEYIIIAIIILILLFAFLFEKFFEHPENHSKIVINKVIGLCISMTSPFVFYTYEWLILIYIMYFTFLRIRIPDAWIEKVNTGWYKFILKDLLAGGLTMICLNIIYSGYNLFPLVKMYFNR